MVGSAPQLSLGCDFHLSYDNLQSLLAQPHLYTIAGASYLLVELSDYSIPSLIGDWFLRLGDRGLTPIITHPERNAILRQTPQRVIEFVELGCAVQITANALTGFWGQRVARVATWLLECDAVHVIASDAHDQAPDADSFRSEGCGRRDRGRGSSAGPARGKPASDSLRTTASLLPETRPQRMSESGVWHRCARDSPLHEHIRVVL
jgi:hypothetical protein